MKQMDVETTLEDIEIAGKAGRRNYFIEDKGFSLTISMLISYGDLITRAASRDLCDVAIQDRRLIIELVILDRKSVRLPNASNIVCSVCQTCWTRAGDHDDIRLINDLVGAFEPAIAFANDKSTFVAIMLSRLHRSIGCWQFDTRNSCNERFQAGSHH